MKIKNIVFFEDEKAFNFLPLTYTRPVFSLACGLFTIKERIVKIFEKENPRISCIIRDGIKAVYKEKNTSEFFDFPNEGNTLFVNARLVNPYFLIDASYACDTLIKSGDGIASVFVCDDTLKKNSFTSLSEVFSFAGSSFEIQEESDAFLVSYLWDMINKTSAITTLDYKHFYKDIKGASLPENIAIVGDITDVYISGDAVVHPFVVLDASGGPVVIEDGAEIHSFSRIEGPSYIGKDAIILGAKIRAGSYIGTRCRAGGEVENSIMLSNSNKYHEGFLGHSYIGEWVNLGAFTTNSDLKNNYSDVDVFVAGKKTDTLYNKIGCFIGDHTKTSIGCLLNTGTYIGVMCNILAAGSLLPKYMPSYSNYANGRFSRHFPLKSLFETAGIVKSRRGDIFTPAEEGLFRDIYDKTKPERDKLKGKYA